VSIDNFIWVPAGIRNDKNIGFRKYKSWAEMNAAEAAKDTPHQAFLAHGQVLIDEQYFFEDPGDARWFWTDGYTARLYLDHQRAPIAYDRMALWIDGEEVATRGHGDTDNVTTESNSLPTAERDGAAGTPDVDL
jgi:hypothetical protein